MDTTVSPGKDPDLKRLLDHLPGLAYRCRLEDGTPSTVEFVSAGADLLLGLSVETIQGKGWNLFERMMIPLDLKRIRAQLQDSILTRQPYQLLYRLVLPDGHVRRIWDQGAPVFNTDGTPRCLEGLMLDVSEQRIQGLLLQDEKVRLQLNLEHGTGLGPLAGKSDAMQKVFELILKAAGTDTNVIIYGETGCGKDLVARAIHNYSGRRGAYVPVNCGAIPENLLESEFFGYAKGAFTGANTAKDGYLAAADNGTLFLDEIGEMPLNLQVKFLRALESKSYTPLGSNTPKTSSFRLVAATNRDLGALVRENKTRADFYYRINVLVILIPPLRERMEDLPLLVKSWCDRKGIALTLPQKVSLAMMRYDWPGNVRELHNFLDRYMAFGASVVESIASGSKGQPVIAPIGEDNLTLEEATTRLERNIIQKTLQKFHGQRGRTAQALGLTMRTLQRKIKSLHLDPDDEERI